MKKLILALIFIPNFAVGQEIPTVNVPLPLRQENYAGGSCVHASWITLLRWQGFREYSTYWRAKYSGGETPWSFQEALEAEGIAYAYTAFHFDVKFLEWAIRTRRGAIVTCMGGRHMVCLVYLDDKYAGILDNNSVGKIKYMTRKQFLSEWANSNSWAAVPLYSPTPPLIRR